MPLQTSPEHGISGGWGRGYDLSTLLEDIQEEARSGILVRRLQDDPDVPCGFKCLAAEGAAYGGAARATRQDAGTGGEKRLVLEGFWARTSAEDRFVERSER